MSSKKIKILVLTSSFPRHKDDWWQRAVLSIYSNMDLNKYAITVVAPAGPIPIYSETIDGVKVRRFDYFFPRSMQVLTSGEGILYSNKRNKILGKIQMITFIVAEFLTALRELAKNEYDIIHANWIIPQGLIAVFCKFIFKKPVVVTVHGTDIFALKKLNFIKAFILKFSDLCTANSSSTYEAVKNAYSKGWAEIVPMGVDLDEFHPRNFDKTWRDQFGKKPKIILGVGRLIKWKGFEYLVRAFAIVLRKFPEAKLVIVGKGPEETNLKSLAKRLGLELDKDLSKGVIFFLGSIGPGMLPKIYASSDLVVSPSITIPKTGEKEGQGNVVLEARASGVPVIASRSGGLVDTVDGKTNGLLFEERDYRELVRLINHMFSNELTRENLGKNGLKHVRGNYSWKQTSSKFTKLYDSIMSS